MKKVFFAMPCYRYREPENLDTIKMLTTTNKHFQIVDVKEAIGIFATSIARKYLIDEFLKSNAEYIFFIDDDMVWIPKDEKDPNPIDKMIQYNLDIASPPTVTRQEPIGYNFASIKTSDLDVWNNTEPFKVKYVGSGFMLVRRNVIETVMKKYPSPFIHRYSLEYNRELSDDVSFCLRAIEHKFSVWVVPGSRIGHVGKYIYTPENIKDYMIEQSRKPIKF